MRGLTVRNLLAFSFSLVLFACGAQDHIARDTDSEISVNPSSWAQVSRSQMSIGVDKYFSGGSSSSFFSCLAKQNVHVFIATYNTGLAGGSAVDTHLRNAQAAGLDLSAYFAFNSASDLSDSAIQDFLRRIRPFPIKTVWLDIERPASNIDSLTSNWHQKVCVEAGYRCGVYTNFGGMSAANYPKSYRAPLEKMYLWFALWDNRVTPNAEVGNFYAWQKSHGKQFANGQVCGTEIDANAFEPQVFTGAGPSGTGGGGSAGGSGKTGDQDQITGPRCIIGNLSGDRSVKLRAQPSTQSSVLRSVPDGESVSVKRLVKGQSISDPVLGRSSADWGEIDDGGSTGYINSLYLNCRS